MEREEHPSPAVTEGGCQARDAGRCNSVLCAFCFSAANHQYKQTPCCLLKVKKLFMYGNEIEVTHTKMLILGSGSSRYLYLFAFLSIFFKLIN